MLIPTVAHLFSTLAWLFAAMQASISPHYATLLPSIEGVTTVVSSLVAMPISPFKISTVKTLSAPPTNSSSWSFFSLSLNVSVGVKVGSILVKFSFPPVPSPFVPLLNATEPGATAGLINATVGNLSSTQPLEASAEAVALDILFRSLAQDTCAHDFVGDAATSDADKEEPALAFADGENILANVVTQTMLGPTCSHSDSIEATRVTRTFKAATPLELSINAGYDRLVNRTHNARLATADTAFLDIETTGVFEGVCMANASFEEASFYEALPASSTDSSIPANEPSNHALCEEVESCAIVVWTTPKPSTFDKASDVNYGRYGFWTLLMCMVRLSFKLIGVIFLYEACCISAVPLGWSFPLLIDAVCPMTKAFVLFILSEEPSFREPTALPEVCFEDEFEGDVAPVIVEEDLQITDVPAPLRSPIVPLEDSPIDQGPQTVAVQVVDVILETSVATGPPSTRVRNRKTKSSQFGRSQLSKSFRNKQKGGKRKGKGKDMFASVLLQLDDQVVLPLVDMDDESADDAIPEVTVNAPNPNTGPSNRGKKSVRTRRKRNVVIPNITDVTASRPISARVTSCPSLEVTMAGLRSNMFTYTQTNAGGKWRVERMMNAIAFAPSCATDNTNEFGMEWDEEGWEEVKGRKKWKEKRDVDEGDMYEEEEEEEGEGDEVFEDDYDEVYGGSLPASL